MRLKNDKMANLELVEPPKYWFHVKSQCKKNNAISTLSCDILKWQFSVKMWEFFLKTVFMWNQFLAKPQFRQFHWLWILIVAILHNFSRPKFTKIILQESLHLFLWFLLTKNWFHVKSEEQKNLAISLRWSYNFYR